MDCTGVPGRRLTAHAHSRYTRYALDTRYHDYMSCSQLVEITIGGLRGYSPAVWEGRQVREAMLGIHAAVCGTGLPGVPRYM